MTETIGSYFDSKSRIHASGTIAPWGCFHFDGQVKRKYTLPREAIHLVGFHPDLIGYAKRGCTLQNDEGRIVVVKGKRVIAQLRPSEIICVEEETFERVSKSGHLGYGQCGQERVLAKAARGEDPEEYDNSRFHKVARRFAGQKVILLLIDEKAKVFLQDGTRIWSKTYTPLAPKRWGKRSLRRPRLFDRMPPSLPGEE